jgi:hypothetical protein
MVDTFVALPVRDRLDDTRRLIDGLPDGVRLFVHDCGSSWHTRKYLDRLVEEDERVVALEKPEGTADLEVFCETWRTALAATKDPAAPRHPDVNVVLITQDADPDAVPGMLARLREAGSTWAVRGDGLYALKAEAAPVGGLPSDPTSWDALDRAIEARGYTVL